MANEDSTQNGERKFNSWLMRALIVMLIGGGGAGIGGALGSNASISSEKQRIEDHITTDNQAKAEFRTDIKRIESGLYDAKASNARLEGEVLARLTAIEAALTEIRTELNRRNRTYPSTPQGSQ